MSVREHDRIDQVAVGPDGRLLLAMTEDRAYGEGSDAVLTEDFRRKLNAYLDIARSGQAHRIAAGTGAEEGQGSRSCCSARLNRLRSCTR
ncbi:hypothetical protein ACIRRA_01835 [Nocardia sp. NPDC101769]|uniref:hypothetical protein n=1 Tax=Nocardia sp. NPDC101769 TaxID=3364333 RepID=UPI003827924F